MNAVKTGIADVAAISGTQEVCTKAADRAGIVKLEAQL